MNCIWVRTKELNEWIKVVDYHNGDDDSTNSKSLTSANKNKQKVLKVFEGHLLTKVLWCIENKKQDSVLRMKICRSDEWNRIKDDKDE